MKRGFLNCPDVFEKASSPSPAQGSSSSATSAKASGASVSSIGKQSFPQVIAPSLQSTIQQVQRLQMAPLSEYMPNSTIPWSLSLYERNEYQPPYEKAFTDAWVKAGKPGTVLRLCKSANGEKVTCLWFTYPDLRYDFNVDSVFVEPLNPEPRPYTVAQIDDCNLGLRATRTIERGEIVIREQPLFLMPHACMATWETIEKNIAESLLYITPEDRARFLSLKNCKPPDVCGPLTGIIRTNGLPAIFPQAKMTGDYSGVFPLLSRANHDCSPNTVYGFDPQTITGEIRAVRRIHAGEEITQSYTKITASRAERQGILKKDYYFTCQCTACAKDSFAVSDNARSFIYSACLLATRRWQIWYDAPSNAATKAYIPELKMILSAINQEKTDSYRGVIVRWLACTYAALGDEKNFKKWAKEAVTCVSVLRNKHGFLSADDWKSWVKDPTKVPFWNTRKHLQLST